MDADLPVNAEEALAVLGSGDAFLAERAARSALAAGADARWLLVLALALSEQRRAIEALPCYEELVRRQPDVPEHWSNLGNCLCELDREKDALPSLQRAYLLGDRSAALFFGLARAELANMRPIHSLTCIGRAIEQVPLDPELLLFKARVQFSLDETDAAVRTLEGLRDPALAVELRVEAAEIQLNLAQYGDAQVSFEAILKEDPSHPSALIGLATCLERHNRLDEAKAAFDAIGDDRVSGRPELESAKRQLQARLAARSGDQAEARTLLRQVLSQPPRDITITSNLHFELGKACAALGDAEGAMAAFTEGHAQRLSHVTAAHPNLSREDGLLAALDRPVPRFDRPRAGDIVDSHRDPLFVVGFPRSGTTLLEQLLDAHPQLASFDEQPFLQRLVTRMNAEPPGYPAALVHCTAEMRAEYRKQYFADVARKLPHLGGRRPVDKNPLYLIRLPLVAALFAEAQVVLALRHPCDVVLSCYMQNFRAPAFAVTFETLLSTARMYDRVFRTYFDFRDALGLPTLELRYEDLVADVGGEARRLIDFLGLEWTDDLMGFTERAKSRGVISTPSYSQVIQPVNNRAIGRWQAWRPWFEGEALEVLAPWVDRFGYRLD
jgi:tetratricopeptide (TPR) repeat protein